MNSYPLKLTRPAVYVGAIPERACSPRQTTIRDPVPQNSSAVRPAQLLLERPVSTKRLIFVLLLALFVLTAIAVASASTQLRLYVLDCGRIELTDLGQFADTGEYDGRAGTLVTPCFLIRHPQGDFLWEAGLGDRYAADPAGVQLPNYRAVVRRTVESQLREIGLEFDDLEYFAFSHAHADHVGNADKLGKATWLVNSKELAWLQASPTPLRTNPALLAARSPEKTRPFTGDYDVFGDGTVRILAAPGHTPGHQVLLVSLRKHGAVLLSGDLYHSRENRAGRRMPVFNVSRAETLTSMDRIEGILRNQSARLIIQHSVADFESLPHAPQFLD
jgi:N-acyl homoserine lactone hydrolase